MAQKIEGATNRCGSCGEKTVCRKITYEGKEKLQWQNHDNSEAHYGFDFQTKKSWCKSKGKETIKEEHKGIDFQKMMDKKEPTTEDLRESLGLLLEDDRNHAKFAIIEEYIQQREACESIGITNPITIGMIWNNRVRGRT